MRPPDGLISRLRETALALMDYLHWNQRHKEADPTKDLSEILPGGARKPGKQGPTSWPVSIAGWMRPKHRNGSEDIPSIDGKDSPVAPELKPICNILRRQASFFVEDVFVDDRAVGVDGSRIGPAQHHYEKTRFYEEYDEEDLLALRNALNLPTTDIWQGSPDHASYRPCYLLVHAPPLRILADMLMDFTFMLVSDYGIDGQRPVYGLHEYNPIAVCSHCDGLFIRTRSDGEFCSVKCRSAAWSQSKGKDYFAQKQRESRAAKRKQREAKRNRKK